jgi:hypothetical protein
VPRLLTFVMAAAGLVFVFLAGGASRTATDWPLAGPALYAVAGACFLLAGWASRRRRGD